MKKTPLSIASILFLLFAQATVCQNTIVHKLSKHELQFPYKATKNEIVVSTPIFPMDAKNDGYKYPEINKATDTMVYKIPLNNLLPQDACVQSTLKKHPVADFALALIKVLDKSKLSYLLLIDENANLSFADENIDTFLIGFPMYKRLNLLVDSVNNIHYTIPVEITCTPNKNGIEIALRNLTYYSLSIGLEDTVLNLNILTNFWHVNFKHTDISLKSNEIAEENLRQNEPFYFNRKLRKLNNIDLLNQTIEFQTLKDNEIPYGYREGYYIDVDELKKNTGSATQLSKCSMRWDQSDFYLLYFWGEWCGPCMATIEETKKIASTLEKEKKVFMINYPTVFNNKEVESLKKVIISKNLPCPQVLQQLNKECSEEICNVVQLVSNFTYPTYILLNKKGKILYRGQNKNKELYELFTKLKIIFE